MGNGMIEGLNVKKIMTESSHLPTMPAVAKELLSISEWENVDLDKVATIISRDVSLSSKILSVVNSPYYGFPRQISTISQALVVLGLRATRSLTLSFSLLKMSPRQRTSQFDYAGFWTRSLNTAVAARELALFTGHGNEEEAFLAGLLQDIGVMVIARSAPEEYGPVLENSRDRLAPPIEMEKATLGVSHVEVAKHLFDKWNLPPSLCTPVLYHHAPEAAEKADEHTMLSIRIQSFAGHVGEWLYSFDSDNASLKELRDLASEFFDISPRELEALMYRVDSRIEEMSDLFDLSASRPNTYANLLEEANLTLSDIVSEQEHLLRELETAKMEAQKLTEQLRIANSRLLDETRRDVLTDLANRRWFEEFFQSELERSRRYEHPLALLFIDVDEFKLINDEYGHLEGDFALKQVATILQGQVRASDIVARYGGEEFVVVLIETDDFNARLIAERIRRSIEETAIPLCDGKNPVTLTVSIGIAAWNPPDKSASIDVCMEKADRAMYKAKRAGKNCVSA